MKIKFVLTLQCLLLCVPASDFSQETGRLQYERLKTQGTCWEAVVTRLETRCADLTDEDRSLLALAFANCHLQRSGLATVECLPGASFELCTRGMDLRAWTAYTEFFTHVFDICAFISARVWQHRTSITVDALSQASAQAAVALDQTVQTAHAIKSDQDRLKDDLTQSVHLNAELRNQIQASRSEVLDMTTQVLDTSKLVRTELKSQQEFVSSWLVRIHELLQEVVRLQELLFGELFDIKSVLYYAVHAGVVYLSTSITETARCRSKLLGLLLLLVLVERLLRVSDQKLWQSIATLRIAVLAGSMLLVVKSYSVYQDVNELNHDLLLQLMRKLSSRTKELLSTRCTKKLPTRRRVFFPLDKIREVRAEQESEAESRICVRRHLRF